MEQFLVPQFIDVEDKIIGPITVKQFIMIMVAGLFIFLEFRFFDFTLFILLAIATLAVLIVLAFLKVNGRPSYYFLMHFIQTLKTPRLRVWKKIPDQALSISAPPTLLKKGSGSSSGQNNELGKAHPTKSQLTQLSLLVDTGGLYGIEGQSDLES